MENQGDYSRFTFGSSDCYHSALIIIKEKLDLSDDFILMQK